MSNLKLNESSYHKNGFSRLLGIDEAGRGALCGPVVVCGVVFDEHTIIEGLDDSKKITPKRRLVLFNQIIALASSVYVEIVGIDAIDTLNVYQATKQANLIICNELKGKYDFILTDAMPLKLEDCDAHIKGDAKFHSIAAASIIAKVVRDHIMEQLSFVYPQYCLGKHKGYATKQHKQLISEFGYVDSIYRKSFEPVKSMASIKLFADI